MILLCQNFCYFVKRQFCYFVEEIKFVLRETFTGFGIRDGYEHNTKERKWLW